MTHSSHDVCAARRGKKMCESNYPACALSGDGACEKEEGGSGGAKLAMQVIQRAGCEVQREGPKALISFRIPKFDCHFQKIYN